MGEVNAELAEMYGTVSPEASPEDAAVEKIAAALEEQGIDFDSLPEDEQQALLSEALEDETVEGSEEAGDEKTAESKLAEADMMGRIMAHSFTQESDLLKEAAKRKAKETLMQKAKSKLKGGYRFAKRKAKLYGGKALRAAKSKPGVGVLAGLGGVGAGYAAGRAKQSADEAFNEAVEEKVLNILTDLGLVEEAGQE